MLWRKGIVRNNQLNPLANKPLVDFDQGDTPVEW